MFTPVSSAPRPAGLSHKNRDQIVPKSKSESHVIAVRVSTEERESLTALAEIEGKTVSAYVRALLVGAKARPRPVLAAAGELLAICATLNDATKKLALNDSERALIEEHARRVITIVRLHGRGETQ